MQRIIGLDLGSKTIGIAYSDLTQTIATPYKTLVFRENNYYDGLKLLLKHLKQFDISEIVLGMPKHMSGDVGIRGNISEQFKSMLLEHDFKVILWDERLSTKAADKSLIEQNFKRKKRKEIIDEMAAVVILQGYLDSLKIKNL